MVFFKASWDYRISKWFGIGVTPFTLAFRYDVVLSMKVVVPSLWVARKIFMALANYTEAMMMEVQ